MAGKIERVNFEQIGIGVKKGQAGVVVVHDASERRNDATEKIDQFPAGDQDVVDVE